MHLGELIKQYRTTNNLSMEEFGKLIGKSKAYISMLEKNRNSRSGKEIAPSMATFVAVANVLHVTLDELLESLDEDQLITINTPSESESDEPTNFVECTRPREIKIPLYGSVAAGEGGFADNHIEDYITVIESDFNDGEYFALKVTGDSMYPKIEEGDIIIVKKAELPVNREICVILVNGDEATVKEVLINSDGITLVAFNRNVYEPHFYSNEEIESLPVKCVGVVKEIRRRL